MFLYIIFFDTYLTDLSIKYKISGLPGWMSIFVRQDKGNIDEILSFIPDPEKFEEGISNEKRKKVVHKVLNLDFLLIQVMGVLQPLDWNVFTKNEVYLHI